MNDPKDIRFRPKGALVTVRIKVGKKWRDYSRGWRTRAEAMEPAIALRDRLQAEYRMGHPELEPAPQPSAKLELKKNSFELALNGELERMRKRQGWLSPRNYNSAKNYLLRGMGDKVALPPKAQVPKTFAGVRELLLSSNLKQRTIDLYAKLIREMLGFLVPLGLPSSCIDELTRLPRKGVTAPGGTAFQQAHIRAMLQREAMQPETTRILFWIGASGGPQIADAVFIPTDGIDWTTGMLTYGRVKTEEPIQFAALPPLLPLLRERVDRLGPDAAYVLPELIFKRAELKRPDCNRKRFEGEPPKRVKERAGGRGIQVMNAFLDACGIKTGALTFKSWRVHNISFWASIGIKLKTRMRMAGHSDPACHNLYDTASEFEIMRAKDITWSYLQAIRDGRDFFIPTTPYDIYEKLLQHWDKFPDIMRHSMREELGETFENLRALLFASFAVQRALIERQTTILQADNAQLRDQFRVQEVQLRAQAGHLQAIEASLQRLFAHLGIEAPAVS